MHCRIFTHTPDLHSLDANRTIPPVVTIKNVSRHCQMSPWGKVSVVETSNRERTECGKALRQAGAEGRVIVAGGEEGEKK